MPELATPSAGFGTTSRSSPADQERTLAFSAAVWAIAMALGPVLQVRRIVDQQSSRGVSISYFLVLLIGFGLWFAYGVAAANLALIVPNVIAAIASTSSRRPASPSLALR